MIYLFLAAVVLTGVDGGYLQGKLLSTSADYGQFSDRYFLGYANIGDQSDIIRTFVNRNAWRLFEHHPLAGVGATGYANWAQGLYSDDLSMNIHGEIHRVPAEGGLIGIAIGFLYLLTTGVRVAAFAFRRGTGQDGTGRREALQLAPLYLFFFAVSYCSFEALNTALLVILSMSALVAARLPPLQMGALLSARPSLAPRSRRRPPILRARSGDVGGATRGWLRKGAPTARQ